MHGTLNVSLSQMTLMWLELGHAGSNYVCHGRGACRACCFYICPPFFKQGNSPSREETPSSRATSTASQVGFTWMETRPSPTPDQRRITSEKGRKSTPSTALTHSASIWGPAGGSQMPSGVSRAQSPAGFPPASGRVLRLLGGTILRRGCTCPGTAPRGLLCLPSSSCTHSR